MPISAASRRALLRWFDRYARDLPWRADRDAYRIWVSEVMLQQTTVGVVSRRFPEFIARFPTVTALASADEQDVLKAWEGLGYYSRARNLHRAAKVLAKHVTLPDDPAVWADLPGIGRYILGAVLSQAFDRRLPIVEANTKRVLCRLAAETGDVKSAAVQARLWQRAADIVPKNRAGDFNQAMMELGALVCTPRQPRCGECPVRRDCKAFALGIQDDLPRASPKPTLVHSREVCLVVRRRGRVLLMRRPAGGRWANMWEFPHAVLTPEESPDDGGRRLIASMDLNASIVREREVVHYGVTRFRMAMTCLDAVASRAGFSTGYYEEGRWLTPVEVSARPVSTPHRRLAASL